jgi:hypothetical protein
MDQSNQKNYLQQELEYFAEIEAYFSGATGSFTEKMHAFARFVPRQAISYFLARNEIFKQVLQLHGSLFDFGIYRGSSFFTWQQLSAIYEPYNHLRKIVGFDSFEGFSALGENDHGKEGKDLALKRQGGMKFEQGRMEMERGVALCDMNRPIGHVCKASVVVGDLPGAFAQYLDEHQETVVAMANFGLGLYEPTLELLNLLKPRLQAGSVVVLEDLNQATWPGETKALFEVFRSDEISLTRVPYCPHISYFRVGASGIR